MSGGLTDPNIRAMGELRRRAQLAVAERHADEVDREYARLLRAAGFVPVVEESKRWVRK